METFIKITQFICCFSLLVIIHELGHFLFARMFGIRVEKFYLFFNPGFSLLKFNYKGTEYGIGWVPFGGYVKIAGMIDESLDTEQMKQPPKPDEFRSKPSWQRLLVMLGGVMMNILFAIVIYIEMSFSYGERYIANDDLKYGYYFNELGHELGFRDGDRIVTVDGQHIENSARVYLDIVVGQAKNIEVLRDGVKTEVYIPDGYTGRMLDSPDFMDARIPFIVGQPLEGSGAARAGIMPEDSLIALNGQPMAFFEQYRSALAGHKGGTVEITLVRDQEGVPVEMTLPVEVSDEGTIGILPYGITRYVPIRHHDYTFLQSIPVGVKRTGSEVASYWRQVKLLFQPKTEAYKSIGGFISIGSIFPKYWDWEIFWRITALLSIMLAIMNILPIPALDGGHVLFLVYEMVTGHKPGDRFLEAAQIVGVLLIFGLIIFATGNDIYRFFIK